MGCLAKQVLAFDLAGFRRTIPTFSGALLPCFPRKSERAAWPKSGNLARLSAAILQAFSPRSGSLGTVLSASKKGTPDQRRTSTLAAVRRRKRTRWSAPPADIGSTSHVKD